MSPLSAKLLALLAALAVVATVMPGALADDAKPRKHAKHKKVVAERSSKAPQYRGAGKFPAGPVYFSGEYLGDDPDPNIRFQLYRDLGVHFGGEP